MTDPEQLTLTPRCPRCGAPLYDNWELRELSLAALAALERYKLALPDGVKLALRLVAQNMNCRDQRCEASPCAPQ